MVTTALGVSMMLPGTVVDPRTVANDHSVVVTGRVVLGRNTMMDARTVVCMRTVMDHRPVAWTGHVAFVATVGSRMVAVSVAPVMGVLRHALWSREKSECSGGTGE